MTQVFLMRPPQVTSADRFVPFIEAMKEAGIQRVMLLSVAGAKSNPLLPHHGIEQLLLGSGLPSIILRPADFMQNLETVHLTSIRDRNEIAVPAGKGRSAFIDVEDIGACAAKLLMDLSSTSTGYTLTGPRDYDFATVADTLTQVLGRTITYRQPSALRFVSEQRDQDVPTPMALVMLALYSVQRFGFAAKPTGDVEVILGRPASGLEAYITRERVRWIPEVISA